MMSLVRKSCDRPVLNIGGRDGVEGLTISAWSGEFILLDPNVERVEVRIMSRKAFFLYFDVSNW